MRKLRRYLFGQLLQPGKPRNCDCNLCGTAAGIAAHSAHRNMQAMSARCSLRRTVTNCYAKPAQLA